MVDFDQYQNFHFEGGKLHNGTSHVSLPNTSRSRPSKTKEFRHFDNFVFYYYRGCGSLISSVEETCYSSVIDTDFNLRQTMDRLQHGHPSGLHRKTTPHFRWFFFLAGIKTIGAMMLPFDSNRSQPIPNILADTFFSKNGQVKFWPDNENFGSVKKNRLFLSYSS